MNTVRISQHAADEWYVSVGNGHYANPLPKQTALHQAFQYARQVGVDEVEVVDLQGERVETVRVAALAFPS